MDNSVNLPLNNFILTQKFSELLALFEGQKDIKKEWKCILTLQIPNSHYEKKKLKTGKNLLVLSESLLVTIARIWDSVRVSMSQQVFNTGKSWLILSNFLDLGMEFVYEKLTTYKIASPRKSIFSMIIFSTLKQFYNKPYVQFFISMR